jgi:hypothetical protein
MARISGSRNQRVGMPPMASVVEEKALVPPRAAMASHAPSAASRPAYRILRTNQFDAYDTALPRAEIPSLGARVSVTENFAGTARKAAKLSVADAEPEIFDDVKDLIDTLPSKRTMTAHRPKVTTDAESNRVDEEKRNVRVRAFLYAASREDDNDFHLIVGRDRAASPQQYMTMEISGLPPPASRHFSRLKAARDAYKAFFGADLPGPSYDFYDPPVPIEIAGSLFFDMSHAQGQGPGPQSLRRNIPTIWEVHPVTEILFEP